MEFTDEGRVIVRYWRSIAVVVGLAAAAAAVFGLASAARYTSSSRVLFSGPDGPTLQLAVLTYADLATTPAVLGSRDPTSVRIVAKPGSAVLSIEVTDTNAAKAEKNANAVAGRLVEVTNEIDADQPTVGKVVAPATAAVSQRADDVVAQVVGGVMGGLVFGVMQAYARSLRRRR